jgi:hypothetical protein
MTGWPITLDLGFRPEEEISARAHRYGWTLSDIVTAEVKEERKARAPLHP